jgi:cation transport ATPase
MKNLKRSMIAILILMMGMQVNVFAQKKSKVKEVKIKTSAVCGMCKKRIESNIKFEKGVRALELDDKTKVLTVTYRADKTSSEKIRKAISKLGYDADKVKADQKAHDKLPSCCQKGNKLH